MGNRAASLRNEILAQHPNATLAKRGRRNLIFELPDAPEGKRAFHAVSTLNDLHYVDENGWQEVDTDWRDGDAEYPDVVDRMAWKVGSGADGRRRVYPRRDRPDEYISFQRPKILVNSNWVNAPFTGRSRSGSLITFTGNDADVEIRILPNRFKVDFILKNPAAVRPIRWPLTLTGLRLEGDALYSLADDSFVGRFDPFVMIDADGTTRDVPMQMTETAIRLDPDVTGLTFPVRVDPSVTLYTAGSDDADEATTGAVDVSDTQSIAPIDSSGEWVGLRFQNVTIPPGSTITSSYITLYFPSSTADEPQHPIYGQKSLHPLTFTTATNDISSRPLTTATVTWDNTDLGAPGSFSSPSLNTIIQEIVNQSGWSYGNPIAILLRGGGDLSRDLTVYFSENTAVGTDPALYLAWTEPTGMSYTTENHTPQANGDDGYWAGATFGNTNTTLPVGTTSGLTYNAFIRFPNVSLVSGDTVGAAWLQLKALSTNTSALRLRIYGIDESAPIAPTSSSNISSRARTTAYVDWTFEAGMTSGVTYESPSISPILQELMASGYAGSGILLVLETDTGYTVSATPTRQFSAYDHTTEPAPNLELYYSPGGTTYTETTGSTVARSYEFGTDTAIRRDLTGHTLLRAQSGGADSALLYDLNDTLTIFAQMNGTDIKAIVDMANAVTLLAQTLGEDSIGWLDVGGLITLLAETAGTDTGTFYSLGQTDVLSAVTGGLDALDATDAAGLITLLSELAGTDALTLGELGGYTLLHAIVDGSVEAIGINEFGVTPVLVTVITDGMDLRGAVELDGLVLARAQMNGSESIAFGDFAGQILALAQLAGADTSQMQELTDEVLILATFSSTVEGGGVFDIEGQTLLFLLTEGIDRLIVGTGAAYELVNLVIVNPYAVAFEE